MTKRSAAGNDERNGERMTKRSETDGNFGFLAYICNQFKNEDKPMKTIAAILAGGSGLRVGGGVPKQLLPLGGKPVLEHSIAAFDAHPDVDCVVVVCREDLIPAVENLVLRGGYRKVLGVIAGGDDRSASSIAAVRFATDRASETPLHEYKLLLHDAARPLIDSQTITHCINALDDYDAAEVVAPATDTVVLMRPDGLLKEVLPRETIGLVQTPQGFRLNVIAEAYRRAQADPAFTATDDCSVVYKYLPGTSIRLVEGTPRNRKLTFPSDIKVLEALLKN